MSYNHYQNNAPGWGTAQYQFAAPPAPTFHPQPTWGGMDYYRAHALSPDPALYDNVWNTVRDHSSIPSAAGVGLNQARAWHRRVFGGLGSLNSMLPSELGHAAAYEAYRIWSHNPSIYEPLGPDLERRREGLIGLAIAEASRLGRAARLLDPASRSEASLAAATTVSALFQQDAAEEYARLGPGGAPSMGAPGAMVPPTNGADAAGFGVMGNASAMSMPQAAETGAAVTAAQPQYVINLPPPMVNPAMPAGAQTGAVEAGVGAGILGGGPGLLGSSVPNTASGTMVPNPATAPTSTLGKVFSSLGGNPYEADDEIMRRRGRRGGLFGLGRSRALSLSPSRSANAALPGTAGPGFPGMGAPMAGPGTGMSGIGNPVYSQGGYIYGQPGEYQNAAGVPVQPGYAQGQGVVPQGGTTVVVAPSPRRRHKHRHHHHHRPRARSIDSSSSWY